VFGTAYMKNSEIHLPIYYKHFMRYPVAYLTCVYKLNQLKLTTSFIGSGITCFGFLLPFKFNISMSGVDRENRLLISGTSTGFYYADHKPITHVMTNEEGYTKLVGLDKIQFEKKYHQIK